MVAESSVDELDGEICHKQHKGCLPGSGFREGIKRRRQNIKNKIGWDEPVGHACTCHEHISDSAGQFQSGQAEGQGDADGEEGNLEQEREQTFPGSTDAEPAGDQDEQVDADDAGLLPENPQEGSYRRERPFGSRDRPQCADCMKDQDHQHRDDPEEFNVRISFFHGRP